MRPTLSSTALLAATLTFAVVCALPERLQAQIPDSTLVADSTFVADSTLVTDSTLVADSTQSADSLRSFAQLPEAVLMHLAHLSDAFPDTPGGMGLIETGLAEAEIAAEYVALAGQNSTNLARMIGNMSHVLHAIDPVEVGNGFGLGYGVRRAAQGILLHIELAVADEDAPETVVFHAGYIAAAASGALSRADEAVSVARSIQRATTPAQALRLIENLADLVRAMAYGADDDRDGRIGYPDTESGLAQARYHLDLIRRAHSPAGPISDRENRSISRTRSCCCCANPGSRAVRWSRGTV